jgi:hypothetical protein
MHKFELRQSQPAIRHAVASIAQALTFSVGSKDKREMVWSAEAQRICGKQRNSWVALPIQIAISGSTHTLAIRELAMHQIYRSICPG